MTNEITTIAALATSPHPAGIAVVRVSGPRAKTALRAIFKSKKDPVEDPRRLVFGDLIDYHSGATIDHAMAVYMPGPFSFTGEDICEFQFHGSPLLVQKVLRSLFAFGALPAEAGEFTKRAFLNGKIDLIQAEAIADLIGATGEQALKIAGEQLKGRLSEALGKVGEPLRDSLAELEAAIDFPEEDIEPQKLSAMEKALQNTNSVLLKMLESFSYGHVVKEGFRILLCGRPNAGKSSILNRILGQERAIVTDVSGTTRDLIEAEATFGGYKFVFCDSAGIIETFDAVEKIGVELAKQRIPWADVVLYVADATDSSDAWKTVLDDLRKSAKKIWMITNKIDLNPNAIATFFCDSNICAQNFYVSAKTRHGFDALIQALVEEVATNMSVHSDTSLVVTNERQRAGLERAHAALNRTLLGFKEKLPPEILSAEIRIALTALEEIVGKTYTEDILGRIFAKFCVGK